MSDRYGVLSGDLVKSSKLTPDQIDRARATIETAVAQATKHFARKRGLVVGKADFYRGDAWQAALSEPGLALRATVLIRARLKALDAADTRISIGVGAVDRLDKPRLSRSVGPAFERSGRGLDAMPARARLAATIDEAEPARPWVSAVVVLIDQLMSGWTPRQAEIAVEALRLPEPTQDEIAARVEPAVTRQVVQKAVDAMNWSSVAAALEAWEGHPW